MQHPWHTGIIFLSCIINLRVETILFKPQTTTIINQQGWGASFTICHACGHEKMGANRKSHGKLKVKFMGCATEAMKKIRVCFTQAFGFLGFVETTENKDT